MRKKYDDFLKVCPKKAVLIPFFCIIFSLQVQGAQKLVPSGKTTGITLDTKGLLVLGTGSVDGENNQTHTPCKGILQAGDLLLKADGHVLENKETFMKLVEESDGKAVLLRLERNGREKEVRITPVFSRTDGTYKIGVWVRDSIQGIGTVTYYDAAEQTFGALGHGVYDVDADALLEISGGALTGVELAEIVKGEKGKAGELKGEIFLQEKNAEVFENTEAGIFGRVEGTVFENLPAMEIGMVNEGKAAILSDLEGGEVQEYAVQIEEVRKNGGRAHKDMILRITDERLLKLTGGIVQGMSGSPIIQDGKLVGAVTHVLVNDPTRGYGIFIENMLEAAG